jgi:hypothetical protein
MKIERFNNIPEVIYHGLGANITMPSLFAINYQRRQLVTNQCNQTLLNPQSIQLRTSELDRSIIANTADPSWGDDMDSRRSTGGYVYKLCGGPISWKSGRQPIVTLSSTEAEFVSLTVAAREAAAISRLLKEIMLYQGSTEPVQLLEDNQPAINLTKRPLSDGRTKQIDIRWCYIQQQVKKGAIKVNWISTNDQAADGLVKALNRVKFARFKDLIEVVDCTVAIKSATIR